MQIAGTRAGSACVKTGLDVLLSRHLEDLRGSSVGVVANHAAVTSNLVHISDALSGAGANIRALYGPEHGVRGDIADGEPIEDFVDRRLGVPVYSLYGKTRVPTSEMLAGIDVMLIDLQDVGARFYTFVYTMANVMGACGDHGIPVRVLDRPNPIAGLAVEGPILEPEFSSFIGLYSVPVRHGLTLGELAELFRTQFGAVCDLRVVEMDGWERSMWYDHTGLPWVPPSPNMPTLDTAVVYPCTCFIEGTNASEGRGTTRPFETFGAPWVDPVEFRDCLMGYGLPGVAFRETYFTPSLSKFQGERCAGVQLYVTDRAAFRPVLTGVAIISAFRKLYPNQFAFREPGAQGKRFFDLLAGSTSVREQIEEGKSPWDIAAGWSEGERAFEQTARQVWIYE